MTDEELIERLRWRKESLDAAAADRIEALVKDGAEWATLAADYNDKFDAQKRRAERLKAALREIESISVHSDGEIHGVTALRWELAFEQAQGTARDALIGVEHD